MLFNSIKSRLTQTCVLVVFSLAIMVPATLVNAAGSEANFAINGKARVIYVVDGDTMNISVRDPETWETLRDKAKIAENNRQRNLNIGRTFKERDHSFRVRIGGIDTPESVHPDKSRNTPEGKEASRFAKSIISDKNVGFACWDIGHHGRPICSIWSSEGDFATQIIEAGYSQYIVKYGKHPFWHDHYSNL